MPFISGERMRASFRIILVAIPSILFSVAVHSQEIEPIMGNWVANGASCKSVKDGSDEGILRIRKDKIDFYESECKIRSVKRSEQSFSISAICEAEGEAERKSFVVELVSRTKIKIKGGFEYARCP